MKNKFEVPFSSLGTRSAVIPTILDNLPASCISSIMIYILASVSGLLDGYTGPLNTAG